MPTMTTFVGGSAKLRTMYQPIEVHGIEAAMTDTEAACKHDGARPEDEDAEYEYEEVVESDEHGEDDDGVTYEYEEMETEENGQDDEAGAVAGLNDADDVEINSNHQLPMVDVHPSEPAEEPAHTQSQLSDVEEDTEAGVVHVDACLIEPVAENSDCSEVRGEKEAPQSQPETELEVRAEMDALESELGTELQVRAELEAPQSEREDIKNNA
ncbi:midasin-like [Hordeum vulgare]|nr:midasin-like [Hordeum vulgare]